MIDPRVERRIKARQSRFEFAGKVFIIRRPTPWEAMEMGARIKQLDVIENFVDGWEGITDADMFAGGDSAPAEFSKELLADWIKDNPEFWAPLTDAILKQFHDHADRVAETKKK